MEPPFLPAVTIIIIGRNEAKNLPTCIRSAQNMDYPAAKVTILYIDTSSTDGSPEVARSFGIKVFEENGKTPTAALARNRGLKESSTEIIHFVDGDMEIDSGYLQEAVNQVGKNGVVCVFGRLQERFARENWVANLLDYPWKIKMPGFYDSPGAGGTFMRNALLDVGGYNPRLARGEETELGLRLRNRGYKILLIDHIMGIHDYGTTTLIGVWKRYVGMGRHFGSLLSMKGKDVVSAERRTALKFAIQGAVAFMFTLFVSVTTLWWLLLVLPILLLVYILFRYWQPPVLRQVRLEYFLMEYLFKPAIWWGILVVLFRSKTR